MARRARLASDLGTTEIDILAIKYLGLKTFCNRTIGAALIVEFHVFGTRDGGESWLENAVAAGRAAYLCAGLRLVGRTERSPGT